MKGMLWFDDRKTSPESIITDAMEYFVKKYDVVPIKIYLPLDFSDVKLEGEIEIIKTKSLTKYHLLLEPRAFKKEVDVIMGDERD